MSGYIHLFLSILEKYLPQAFKKMFNPYYVSM